jgi:hypothetical protein
MTNPWQEPTFLARLAEEAGAEPLSTRLREAIAAAHHARNKAAQHKWWLTYVPDLVGNRDYSVFHQALVVHPDTPHWLVQATAKTEVAAFRIPTLLHPHVPARFVANHRQVVLDDVLAHLAQPGALWSDCPGSLYLVLRHAPEVLSEWETEPADRKRSYLRGTAERGHFLTRLAIALSLNDTDTDDQEIRKLLLDDPNRFVRAAARKEIV